MADLFIFYSHHSGQMCAAGSRIFVQEGIYDKFIQAFAAASQTIKHGDGFQSATDQGGPVVSKTQLDVRRRSFSTSQHR